MNGLEVLEEPGRSTTGPERALALPTLINRGLDANDRAKYFLALLQAARQHADDPTAPCSSLREERLTAAVTEAALDEVVEGAERLDASRYRIPRASVLGTKLVEAIETMIAPFAGEGDEHDEYQGRLRLLLAELPDLEGDVLPRRVIQHLTMADPAVGDSVHLLVMDLHKGLSRLQARVATEDLAGAAVYGLGDGDRPLVRAFMEGVHATAALKFDHPGLATTATRSQGRLLVQNDLGENQAHLIVIEVDGLVARLTYTDIHERRLLFFRDLLDEFPMQWTGRGASSGAAIGDQFLLEGEYRAPDQRELERYLRHVGSRLVFLIDWNRARKRLAAMVGNREATELLRWAADRDVGHMGWLVCGGERLVLDVVASTPKISAQYGEPLRDVLGANATVAVLRAALETTARGLLAGKSQLLIRDEFRVELVRHVRAGQRRLLDQVAGHASLIVETAQALRGALLRADGDEGAAFLARASRRAARWEHRADEILTSVRQTARQVGEIETLLAALSAADDAIDDLEESLFLLTLVPSESMAAFRAALDALAALAVAAAREHLKAVEIARDVVIGGDEEDFEDFLVAIDHVAGLEHDADRAERTARATLVTHAPDFRALHIADRISCGIEDATDALARSGLRLREHVLAQATAR